MALIPTQRSDKAWLLAASIALTLGMTTLAVTTLVLHVANRQQQATLRTQKAALIEQSRQLEILARAQALYAAGQYQPCVDLLNENEMEKISADSPVRPVARSLRADCYDPLAATWLAEAEALVAQGELRQAIAVARRIQAGSLQSTATRKIQAWSQRILSLAEARYRSRDNGLAAAVTMANTLEPDNPLYSEAQDRVQAWRQTWETNGQHVETARQAIAAGDLAYAEQQAQQISDHPFWLRHRENLLEQIQFKRRRYQAIWQQAQQAVAREQGAAALQQAEQLPDTLPWMARKQAIADQVAELRERQSEAARQQTARGVLNLLLASLGGSGFGFIGGLSRR